MRGTMKLQAEINSEFDMDHFCNFITAKLDNPKFSSNPWEIFVVIPTPEFASVFLHNLKESLDVNGLTDKSDNLNVNIFLSKRGFDGEENETEDQENTDEFF